MYYYHFAFSLNDIQSIINSFYMQSLMNPKLAKCVGHIPLSYSKNDAQQLANFIGKKHKEKLERLDCFQFELTKRREFISNLPKHKQISLEPIIKLIPKQKKIAFFSFEFLRTSIVIFSLALLSFCLFTVNIRQMDKCRKLEDLCVKQSEYSQQIQKTEKQDKSKVITKKSK